jgi:hypothetical protein
MERVEGPAHRVGDFHGEAHRVDGWLLALAVSLPLLRQRGTPS